MSTQLALPGEDMRALTVQPQQDTSIVQIIDKLANTPNLTLEAVSVIERLVALQMEVDRQKRKELFDAALARVQAIVPRVKQNGLMDRGAGKGQIPFAKLEDVDAAVRPIYSGEGFSVTWDAPTSDESGNITVLGRFSCCGHTEERRWVCKPDSSGGKTGPQAVSSTIAYGKRQVSKMFWNIIEEGKDQNGAATQNFITQDQADTLDSLLAEINVNKADFLKFMGAGKLSEVLATDYQRGINALEAKRRKASR